MYRYVQRKMKTLLCFLILVSVGHVSILNFLSLVSFFILNFYFGYVDAFGPFEMSNMAVSVQIELLHFVK